MPVVNVNLMIDDKTYAGVMSGVLELGGLVKDVSSHRIRKHLPTVADSAKEGAAKAIDVVRENKKALLVVGGVLAVGGAAFGVVSYFSQREKRKAEKRFSKALQKYIDTAKSGELSIDVLDDLISSIDDLMKHNPDGQFPINVSARQMSDLFNSIYDFTKRMAEANSFDSRHIKAPSRFSKNKVLDLQQYLNIQREILSNAS